MTKKRILLWLIPTLILLLLVPFIVPSAIPYAGAEGADLPAYTPVELANPNPAPLLPLPSAKDADPTPYAPHADGFTYDDATGAPVSYLDGTISVRVDKRVVRDTNVFYTWIQIADPSQMRTQITRETSPVKLAQRLRSVAAINGDWYSGRAEGTIYRNAVQLRDKPCKGRYDLLIIDDEGDFHILRRHGKLMTDDEDTFVRNQYGSGAGMGLQNRTQRQAICQMGKLSYLIITTEGPGSKQDKDHGFTAAELAQLAYDAGAVNAYNMDGGNSACLTLNGVKLNRFGKGGIREITDMIYFITAEPAPAATEAPAAAPTETEGSAEQ